MSPFKPGSVIRRRQLASAAAIGELALVCTWAICGLTVTGAAVWFGFDVVTILGIAS
jgi:hypothetical protein